MLFINRSQILIMKKHLFFCRLFIALLLSSSFSYSQDHFCGMPEPSSEQYEAYRQKLVTHLTNPPENLSNNLIQNNHYELPIHLYIINDDDGNPPNATTGVDDLVSFFHHRLEALHHFFPEEIQFYLYKVDYINDSELQLLQDPSYIYFLFTSEDPNLIEDNAIRVILNNEPVGRGNFPNGIKLPAVLNLGNIVHEFGHYFGLYHTFHKTFNSSCIRIFPDDSFNYDCPSFEEFPDCEGIPLGNCYGDMIAQTPVDPRNCNSISQLCNTPCEIEVNNTIYEYNPDYYNVMSYYGNGIRFFEEQKKRMLDVLENPDLGESPIGGDMSFLIDDDVPTSTPIAINDNFFANFGQVEIVRWDDNANAFNFYPLNFSAIEIKNISSNQSNITPILNGYFLLPPSLKWDSDQTMTTSFATLNDLNSSFSDICPNVLDFFAYHRLDIFDLVAIVRHIQNIELLPKPYGWIAADVNNTGSITISDIVEIRNIILGFQEEFNHVPTWRFIPRYALTEQWNFNEHFFDNPFTAIWDRDFEQRPYLSTENQESYLDFFDLSLPNIDAHDPITWSLNAVKSGDVTSPVEEEEGIMELQSSIHECIPAGTNFSVVLKSDLYENFHAYQLGLRIDPALKINNIQNQNLPYFSLNNFQLSENAIKTLWLNENPENILESTTEFNEIGLFKLECEAIEDICNIGDVL